MSGESEPPDFEVPGLVIGKMISENSGGIVMPTPRGPDSNDEPWPPAQEKLAGHWRNTNRPYNHIQSIGHFSTNLPAELYSLGFRKTVDSPVDGHIAGFD